MTRDEVMALSEQELRAEIAKELGWILDKCYSWIGSIVVNKGSPSDNIPDEYEYSVIPDWPNDIKAAFELEESVPKDNEFICDAYIRALENVIGKSAGIDSVTDFALIHATAEQRSRAWLIWKKESEK